MEAFKRPYPFKPDQPPCETCGKVASEPEIKKCRYCRDAEELGRSLIKATWIAYSKKKLPDRADTVNAFGWSAQIGSGNPPTEANWIAILGRQNKQESSFLPIQPLARHVPAKNGETQIFEDIAKQAPGRPYLGYLKMDVDRLGERFSFGYRKEGDKAHDHPARLAHLSRALAQFFADNLEALISDKYSLCYIVYSGGDDLIVIGPHNQILGLARWLNQRFRRYLGYEFGSGQETDVLTLSAGISFAQSHLPVPVAVQQAEEALAKAKAGKQGKARNAIHLLGETFSWVEFEQLTGQIWDIDGNPVGLGAEMLDSKRVPSAFLYNLLQYGEMWRGFRNGDRNRLSYQPLLAYQIARNVKKNVTPEVYEWASWLAQVSLRKAGSWQQAMDQLSVMTRLVLLQRTGELDGK